MNSTSSQVLAAGVEVIANASVKTGSISALSA
jgi:hypothetical protein